MPMRILLLLSLVFTWACQKPDLDITPADKNPRTVEDADPNQYTLDPSYPSPTPGLGLVGMACPQGQVPGAAFHKFTVSAHPQGFSLSMAPDNPYPEKVLALLVTTPDAIIPRKPSDEVERGRSLWVVQSLEFPRKAIGPTPLIYGVLPNQAQDVTSLHGPFKNGDQGAFPWDALKPDTCLKISIVTVDPINSIQISSVLYRVGQATTACQAGEELVNGQCQPKVVCKAYEKEVNRQCQLVPSDTNCQLLGQDQGEDLAYIDNECRPADYCEAQGKVLKNNLCINPGDIGIHCRFNYFGSNACLDFRGDQWDEAKMNSACNMGDTKDPPLQPGACTPAEFNTLCQITFAKGEPSYIARKFPGISWQGDEIGYMFAMNAPDFVCGEIYFNGAYSTRDEGNEWDRSTWIPVLDYELQEGGAL